MTRSVIILFQGLIGAYLLAISGVCLSYAAEPSQAYQLKAGFLVNFARFITWPEKSFASPEADIVFCVVGENPFGKALDGVHQKKIGNRYLRVVYAPSFGSIPPCHLLYVAQSETKILLICASMSNLNRLLR